MKPALSCGLHHWISCKPDSVEANHLSASVVADRLERLIELPRAGTLIATYLLAAGRVYLSYQSPGRTVGFYPTLFTSSYPPVTDGCVVSVALSLEFPPVAVSNCLPLCCPDFPHRFKNGAISH